VSKLQKEEEVAMSRRGSDRRGDDRRTKSEAVAVERRGEARRKTPRRRQIDPTTCERDYNDEEIEFMQALDQYKRTSGRMFPTCSEILEVIRALGYQKVPGAALPIPAEEILAEGDDSESLEIESIEG
jgi:hypothetical protein